MGKDIEDRLEFIPWFKVQRQWMRHWKAPLYAEFGFDLGLNWIMSYQKFKMAPRDKVMIENQKEKCPKNSISI